MRKEKAPMWIIVGVIIFIAAYILIPGRGEKEEKIKNVYADMEQTPDSSAFTEIGYDSDMRALVVTFRDSGKTYYYWDVPLAEWNEFKNADSLGSYFNNYIKENYKYDKR